MARVPGMADNEPSRRQMSEFSVPESTDSPRRLHASKHIDKVSSTSTPSCLGMNQCDLSSLRFLGCMDMPADDPSPWYLRLICLIMSYGSRSISLLMFVYTSTYPDMRLAIHIH